MPFGKMTSKNNAKERLAVARAKRHIDDRGFVLIDSEVLGERVAWVNSREGLESIPDGVVSYKMTEVLGLTESGCEAEGLRSVHEAKRLIGGTVVGTISERKSSDEQHSEIPEQPTEV